MLWVITIISLGVVIFLCHWMGEQFRIWEEIMEWGEETRTWNSRNLKEEQVFPKGLQIENKQEIVVWSKSSDQFVFMFKQKKEDPLGRLGMKGWVPLETVRTQLVPVHKTHKEGGEIYTNRAVLLNHMGDLKTEFGVYSSRGKEFIIEVRAPQGEHDKVSPIQPPQIPEYLFRQLRWKVSKMVGK